MTWSRRPAWSFTASTIFGWLWPWILTHHDEMASMMRRPVLGIEIGAFGPRDGNLLGHQGVLGEGVARWRSLEVLHAKVVGKGGLETLGIDTVEPRQAAQNARTGQFG